MHEKLTKCPNFTWYLPEKLTKFPNFTWYMPEKINKMPEFYMFFARKIFFSDFFLFFWGGGKCSACPRLLRLWCCAIIAHSALCANMFTSSYNGNDSEVVKLQEGIKHVSDSLIIKPWLQLRFDYDTTTIRLRSDYDVSRAFASIRHDSTQAKNEHVNFSS